MRSPRLLAAQTLDECQGLRHHGKLAEAQTCYTKLSTSSNLYLRAEGLWGIERYQDANDAFREVIKDNPKNAAYRVRWGHLFLERFNNDEANGLFNEALKIDPNNAPAYLGMAQVEAEGYSQDAVKAAQKAADLDPKLYQAHEELAFLALEDNNEDTAAKQADMALGISGEALDAMAIHSVHRFAARQERHAHGPVAFSRSIPHTAKRTPRPGISSSSIGAMRKASPPIARRSNLKPRLWEARAQLGVNLMRLGDEAEARQQLEAMLQRQLPELRDGQFAAPARQLQGFRHLQDPHHDPAAGQEGSRAAAALFRIRNEARHRGLREEVSDEAEGSGASGSLSRSRGFRRSHHGHARTGRAGRHVRQVVAMDSPSGRTPGQFHWASTLRHEMSHVYVLQATNNRVPRWFTEGLAVYEETAASPDWGDRLDPEAIHAIQNKLLLPVAELDRGFIRPSYPAQVIVSYFQGGKICSYIAEKWGYSKLLDMIHSFAKLESTPEVFEKDLGHFHHRVRQAVPGLAGCADQSNHRAFRSMARKAQDHGGRRAQQGLRRGDSRIGNEIRDWYPDYVEAGSVYELLSDAYLAKGDKDDARKQLEKYNQVGGRDPKLVEQLRHARGRGRPAPESSRRSRSSKLHLS